MKDSQRRFVAVAALAGWVATVGDVVVSLILGFFYPNYNHVELVMSELGTSQSPVALWINLWWVIFGVLFVVFALGVWRAFASDGPAGVIVALLIAVFGLAAGLAAGLFPMDPGGAEITLSGRLHGILGGIGYLALMVVPLVARPLFPQTRASRWLSIAAFVLGVVSFVLFVISEDAPSGAGILSYAGLWQRVFLLDYYVYLDVIAVRMLRRSRRAASPLR